MLVIRVWNGFRISTLKNWLSPSDSENDHPKNRRNFGITNWKIECSPNLIQHYTILIVKWRGIWVVNHPAEIKFNRFLCCEKSINTNGDNEAIDFPTANQTWRLFVPCILLYGELKDWCSSSKSFLICLQQRMAHKNFMLLQHWNGYFHQWFMQLFRD